VLKAALRGTAPCKTSQVRPKWVRKPALALLDRVPALDGFRVRTDLDSADDGAGVVLGLEQFEDELRLLGVDG
jgi:hypothetical protein